ncbi:uncharacterized protein LOC117171569 [Belonocnema kinseyi]|uniref:uncharacterized protein LOC117171569 n=1 Tax=Belonocnema kinseyi TaxID=2817044 RepID=UPI00143D2F02|nr:uncharacterized protein LOC117171569 [Belonocnema kinseyi]
MNNLQIFGILLVLIGGVQPLPTSNLGPNLESNNSFPYSNYTDDYQKWLSVIKINLDYNNSNNNDVSINFSNARKQPVNISEDSITTEGLTSTERLTTGPTTTTNKSTCRSITGLGATTERPNSSVPSVNNISIIEININYSRSNNNSLVVNI